jgi:hypothetical protein
MLWLTLMTELVSGDSFQEVSVLRNICETLTTQITSYCVNSRLQSLFWLKSTLTWVKLETDSHIPHSAIFNYYYLCHMPKHVPTQQFVHRMAVLLHSSCSFNCFLVKASILLAYDGAVRYLERSGTWELDSQRFEITFWSLLQGLKYLWLFLGHFTLEGEKTTLFRSLWDWTLRDAAVYSRDTASTSQRKPKDAHIHSYVLVDGRKNDEFAHASWRMVQRGNWYPVF